MAPPAVAEQPGGVLLTPRQAPPRSRGWAAWAVASGCLFGVSSWTSGYVATHGGGGAAYYCTFYAWLSAGTIFGVAGLARLFVLGVMAESAPERLPPRGCTAAALSGIATVCGMLTLTLGFDAAPDSKGPFSATVAAQCIAVTVFMFLRYGERPRWAECLGILLNFAGVVTMSLCGNGGGGINTGFVVFALCTLLCFAAQTVMLRIAATYGTPAEVSIVLQCLVVFAAGQISTAAVTVVGRVNGELTTWWLRLLPWGGGFAQGLGAYCLTCALRDGVTGVVNAIIGMEPVLVLLLDLLVQNIVPPAGKLVGMVICLVGVLSMSVLPLFLPPPAPLVLPGGAPLKVPLLHGDGGGGDSGDGGEGEGSGEAPAVEP